MKPFLSGISPALGTKLVLGALLALLFSGCTRHKSGGADTLIVALSASPSTLDPRRTTDATGSRLAGLLYSSLVRTGPDLEIIGDAAQSWKYENLVYTFEMKPGLSFSNGREVDAKDIEFSFQQYMSSGSPFVSSYRVIKSVEAVYRKDKRQVKVHLSEPSASLLRDLSSLKILPHKEMKESDANSTGPLIGSGPYTLESYDSGEIRLRAREDHPYIKPKIETLLFKIVRDDNTRFMKIIKGEIDIAQQELPPQKVKELEKRGGFQIIKSPGLSMTYILLNLKDPDLSKKPVREAIAKAIHRDQIIEHKLEGLAQPATSLLTPTNPFFNSSLPHIPYAPNEAKSLLKKMNVQSRSLTLKTSNSPAAIENGQVLVKQLQEAGLTAKLQSHEWGTFYDDIQHGRFQMATLRWVGTLDPDIYRKAFHSEELPPLGRNRGHYKSLKLDGLLEEGIKIENEKKRIAHYLEVQKEVFEELPIIPLWYDMEVAVVNPRVKGYRLPKNGDFTGFIDVQKE